MVEVPVLPVLYLAPVGKPVKSGRGCRGRESELASAAITEAIGPML